MNAGDPVSRSRPCAPRPTSRAGLTLVELLVALTIFGVVISTSVAFVARQNSAFQASLGRLVALRNLRYAIAQLSQDLEALGTNVPAPQPALYYGDDGVVVFSADYATNVADDPFAVFYDPDAPAGQVSAPSTGFAIPTAAVSFPDTTYEATPGVRSPAEVLVFFFEPDTSTARSDDYLLLRQVNQADPEVVARNLLQRGALPFLTYERIASTASGELLQATPDSLLPIHHVAPIHGSPADSGGSALADSVRAVRVNLAATNGRAGEAERRVEISRLIPLPNAGMEVLSTCGSPPLLGVGLAASPTVLGSGEPATRLTWNPAVDEAGGEADVVRYVIWRRESGQPGWGDPYLAIPAGAPSYLYEDAAVSPATAYEYALAAQDCTPTLSSLTTAGPVLIP